MSVPLRSLASARSYFFREHLAGVHPAALERYTLADFRPYWREAVCQALVWRQRVANRWNDQTKRWEQRL